MDICLLVISVTSS